METTGDRVRRLREAKGMSQHKLADASGLNYSTISRIERGQRPGPRTVRDLAAALGVPADQLKGY